MPVHQCASVRTTIENHKSTRRAAQNIRKQHFRCVRSHKVENTRSSHADGWIFEFSMHVRSGATCINVAPRQSNAVAGGTDWELALSRANHHFDVFVVGTYRMQSFPICRWSTAQCLRCAQSAASKRRVDGSATTQYIEMHIRVHFPCTNSCYGKCNPITIFKYRD